MSAKNYTFVLLCCGCTGLIIISPKLWVGASVALVAALCFVLGVLLHKPGPFAISGAIFGGYTIALALGAAGITPGWLLFWMVMAGLVSALLTSGATHDTYGNEVDLAPFGFIFIVLAVLYIFFKFGPDIYAAVQSIGSNMADAMLNYFYDKK